MKANPGGNVAPQNVFGRDKLIEQIWDRLETQSVLLNAERRIGKTSILKKMLGEPRPGWRPVFRDLEKIHSVSEFSELVYDEVQQFLGTAKRAQNWIRKFFEESETDRINLKARSWKQMLVAAIEDLVAAIKEPGNQYDRLVFFWDEVPYMIESIRKKDGEAAAAELLDTLRSLRQEHSELRMIFTGSLGLHHVLGKICAADIPTSPVNDMKHITVTPLAPRDGEHLATELIKGEKLPHQDLKEAAATIADQVDYVPFYIHHVVDGLKVDELHAEADVITALVGRFLVDANDPLELAHFRRRIPIYYQADAPLAIVILDALAIDELDRSLNTLLESVQSKAPEAERDSLDRILKLMEKDHYLARNANGAYQFRFPLIRRWWRLDRGLTSP